MEPSTLVKYVVLIHPKLGNQYDFVLIGLIDPLCTDTMINNVILQLPLFEGLALSFAIVKSMQYY